MGVGARGIMEICSCVAGRSTSGALTRRQRDLGDGGRGWRGCRTNRDDQGRVAGIRYVGPRPGSHVQRRRIHLAERDSAIHATDRVLAESRSDGAGEGGRGAADPRVRPGRVCLAGPAESDPERVLSRPPSRIERGRVCHSGGAAGPASGLRHRRGVRPRDRHEDEHGLPRDRRGLGHGEGASLRPGDATCRRSQAPSSSNGPRVVELGEAARPPRELRVGGARRR